MPSRISANPCSLIDNIWTNNVKFRTKSAILEILLVSDHFAVLQIADACDTAEMKNENKHGQTEVLNFSRNPDQWSLRVNAATRKQIEKIKYLKVPWGTRIGNVSAVMRALL